MEQQAGEFSSQPSSLQVQGFPLLSLHLSSQVGVGDGAVVVVVDIVDEEVGYKSVLQLVSSVGAAGSVFQLRVTVLDGTGCPLSGSLGSWWSGGGPVGLAAQ